MDNIKIKRNILFFPDKEIDKGLTTVEDTVYKPDAKLRIRVRWSEGIVAFNVGYRVKLSQWDTETQRCKVKTTNLQKQSATLINSEIQRLESIIENIFTSFEVFGTTPSPDEVRNRFNQSAGRLSKVEEETDKNLSYYLDLFTSEEGKANDWTNATYEKFNAVKNHLKDFNTNLSFDDLNEKGLSAYLDHLRVVKNMRNSTIGKQTGFLKWFLKWATAKGYNTEQAFLVFSPKLKTSEKKVIFLEWDELMTVYNYQFPDNKNYLDRVRDVFCFCCFTSLRYSDVANLRRSNVFDSYISITTVKTADSLSIELNDYSSAILTKYKDSDFFDDLALPIISNQRMNDYIKEIGELCEINKPITVTYYKGNQRIDEVYPKYELLSTHAGRRTFICNALMLGIAPQVVMKWTGHSDYKAMKPYIDIADSAKVEAMKLFNK